MTDPTIVTTTTTTTTVSTTFTTTLYSTTTTTPEDKSDGKCIDYDVEYSGRIIKGKEVNTYSRCEKL